MNKRRHIAAKHVKRLKGEFGTVTEVARFLDLNVGHISRVCGSGYVAPIVVKRLVDKGIMRPYIRPRVWMPTNNLRAALGKLVEHYPEVEPSIEHLIREE